MYFSFQGYDRWLTFIITQDPLSNTLKDFWRMIIEQSVNTLVMLSELGEGQSKCQCYWPFRGFSHTYDYITIRCEDEASNEAFIVRKLTVANNLVSRSFIFLKLF